MTYLIDADCCVYALTGTHPAIRLRLQERAPGEVAISTVTLSEVMLGSMQGKAPPMSVLEPFLREILLLPYDEAAARAYARMPFKRARFDRLLAAHALSIDATVVTNNTTDFADVPGLRVENWTLAV